MAATATATADRGWADLPTELLGSIARYLTVVDYFRFGAVCSSWGSAASPRDGFFLPLAPQMPWLLLPGDEGERGESCTIVNIHDWRSRRLGPIPEMRGKWCCGSQDGWLALLDEHSEVSLLNPLIRAQIHLPSVTTLRGVDPVYSDDGSLSGYDYTTLPSERLTETIELDYFRCISFKKVIWSSRPTSGNFTAMAIFSVINLIIYASTSEGKWTLFTTGPAVTDIMFHRTKFLTLSDSGDLFAIDVTGPSPQATLLAKGWDIEGDIEGSGDDKHLVDSSGDLLQVWRSARDVSDGQGGNMFATTNIKIMKFDPEQAAWIPLKSLGDNSLFVGLCYSISLSAQEISDLKRNCIYFTEILWEWNYNSDEHRQMMRDVGVFKLDDGSINRYYPPNRRLNWPPPIWFAPSLL